MTEPSEQPQPPRVLDSLRKQWDAFSAWGYERHVRWGDSTLTSSSSWATTFALTLAALVLYVVGLDRHTDQWQWMPGHQQFFFVLQSIAALGLGLLCLWLLTLRPLTRRSAQCAIVMIVMLVVAGLALLSDRANDALMTTGATLLLLMAWRLTAMDSWGPQIMRDLFAMSRRGEHPATPSMARERIAHDTPNAPHSQQESEPNAEADFSEPPSPLNEPSPSSAAIGINAWFVLTVAGTLLLIAALTLPILSISFGDFGSANATLEELARRLEAGEGGLSQGTEVAWRAGWGTIAFGALVIPVGLVGWFRLALFHTSVPRTLLVAGAVLLVIQLAAAILLTAEAEAGSGIVFGTSGFWVNAIAFSAIVGSLWSLSFRNGA